MSVDPSHGWGPPFPPILYDEFDDSQQEESEVSKYKIVPIKSRQEQFSNRLADLSTISKAFFNTNTSIAIDKIRKDYVFLESEEMSIETYLSVNSEMRKTLIDTRSKLTHYFGDECKIGIEFFDDPEEENRVLCIRVETALSPQELITRRFEFHRQWFKQYPISIRQLLAIYLDPK